MYFLQQHKEKYMNISYPFQPESPFIHSFSCAGTFAKQTFASTSWVKGRLQDSRPVCFHNSWELFWRSINLFLKNKKLKFMCNNITGSWMWLYHVRSVQGRANGGCVALGPHLESPNFSIFLLWFFVFCCNESK
jgi:hypothetical protein